MKTLARLQAECLELGIPIPMTDKPAKETYITALRNHHWRMENSNEPLPEQVQPMLLANWQDLDGQVAADIESDGNGWIVQPKLNGVRALLHVEHDRIRITSRCVSELTYRLSEFQDNLPHLAAGMPRMIGTILDGELVCPAKTIDTGVTVTGDPLQAAVAILSTDPQNALAIQERQGAWLQFHVFDILRLSGRDQTQRPLVERCDALAEALAYIDNPHLHAVPSFVVNKDSYHHAVIADGGEGTVWKRIDTPYEPGRRVKHWIKRKAEVQVKAFVSGFKPGSSDRGNAHLVGAVEFSVEEDGTPRPIGWVNNWTDRDRQAMTSFDDQGKVALDETFMGRWAIIAGQSYAAKSGRIQYARLKQWIESPVKNAG